MPSRQQSGGARARLLQLTTACNSLWAIGNTERGTGSQDRHVRTGGSNAPWRIRLKGWPRQPASHCRLSRGVDSCTCRNKVTFQSPRGVRCTTRLDLPSSGANCHVAPVWSMLPVNSPGPCLAACSAPWPIANSGFAWALGLVGALRSAGTVCRAPIDGNARGRCAWSSTCATSLPSLSAYNGTTFLGAGCLPMIISGSDAQILRGGAVGLTASALQPTAAACAGPGAGRALCARVGGARLSQLVTVA